MRTPATDAAKRPVDHFDQNRSIFLSDDFKWDNYLEQESIPYQIAATDKQIEALVYELYGLSYKDVDIVEKGDRR